MFTGIIEQTGTIKELSRRGNIYRLRISPQRKFNSLKNGDSLSINGVCLTLVSIKGDSLEFDIMDETFKRTTFSHLRRNEKVNIERSLKADSRLDGHFVLGHIDKTARIRAITKGRVSYLDIAIDSDDKTYAVKKGSIAIDGISLTIGESYGSSIRVYLIPYTLENTNLKYKKTGDLVNIEFDILAKYIYNRLLRKGG